MKVLVIDIGGTHIKIASTDHPVPLKVVSGPSMNAKKMVEDVLAATTDWQYDCISIGYPGPVTHDRPLAEPHNLASGWVGFPFQSALLKPIRFINDAAMQALGGYTGGKMLFLGIGTGLGSALIVDHVVIPLELAHLPYRKNRTYEQYIGLAGLEHSGKKLWRESVIDVIDRFRAAFVVDYIVLGGGNAKLMKKLPKDVHLGANSNAITGGIALWNQPSAGPQTIVAPSADKPATDATTPAEHPRKQGKGKQGKGKEGKGKQGKKKSDAKSSRGSSKSKQKKHRQSGK